jgi:Family of unknown function (DUF5313)
VAYLLAVKLRTLIVSGLTTTYDGSMTTRAVAADVDPLSLEREVCFALAITNPQLRSATDERTMQVELTTKGRTLRRKALTIPPAVVERLGVDRPLPESIGDRIRNNLTGSAAAPGHLVPSMIPFLAVYAGVALLLPGSLALRVAALVLAVVLALVDSLVFIAIGRRLDQHCRAEDLQNARAARRHEHERDQYERSGNDETRCGTTIFPEKREEWW